MSIVFSVRNAVKQLIWTGVDWTTDGEECSKCGMPNPSKLFGLGCKHTISGNASEAIRFFELAARGGHTDAKNMLGVLLVQTGGNLQVAYRWISEAADEGNKAAMRNRGQVKYYMDPPGPGAMARFDYSWGPERPKGAPEGTILQAPYRR
jgi:TPR repeat protein